MEQPDLTQLLRLMHSPAGIQLLRYLQTAGGSAAQDAAAKAASGDLEAAKNTLGPLLEDPQLQALLRQLGGKL